MHLKITYNLLIWINVFVFSLGLDVMQQSIARRLWVHCPLEKIMDPFLLLTGAFFSKPVKIKGLFTPSVSDDSRFEARRDTLVSVAPFTPSISFIMDTGVNIQKGSGPIQKRQH